MDFRLEMFIKEHLPKGKETFSRDMVELLMKLLWEEAKSAGAARQREQEREDKYGPMWI